MTSYKAVDKEIKSLKQTCTDVNCDNISECWSEEKTKALRKDLYEKNKMVPSL
jgi:lipoate synthase